jgi:hypothetical protein
VFLETFQRKIHIKYKCGPISTIFLVIILEIDFATFYGKSEARLCCYPSSAKSNEASYQPTTALLTRNAFDSDIVHSQIRLNRAVVS